MTFLPYNQDVDATVKEIMIKIRVAMNGVTSELMSDRGVKYKTNFGVAFPDLQKIAQQYSPNELVATYLWHKSVRETKILAILLYPAQALTLEKSITWISDCDTVELIEYLCAHLVVF
nr:DNA alkylation repair protein [Paludibacteraceae bacterium]